ncbi:MAG: NAD(+)/NADH kinase [Anaerolineales bacterium]|nr:NAD(+)/NADH kinase [Anaerolineales bacterium]
MAQKPPEELKTRSLNVFGILYHPHKPVSVPLAEEIKEWLDSRGCRVWIASSWEEEAVYKAMPGTDVVITLGGDGSLLRAARLAVPHKVLLFGVNLGRLGFLSECKPDDWHGPLARLLANDYWVEERMMLTAETWRGESVIGRHLALNDVVISRGTLARAIQLDTYVDGGFLANYFADGLIISTATGSTAYALAVGGPILPPELLNFLIIPIAPHLSMDRAVVLAQGARVNIRIETDHQAILTVDGQYEFDLQSDDKVLITASPHISRFARVQSQTYFYRSLLARLVPTDNRGGDSERGNH